jgi:hypothetical protein
VLLEELMAEGTLGCQNCSGPTSQSYEISELVEVAGELHETPVITIVYYCRLCLELMAVGDWKALEARKAILT